MFLRLSYLILILNVLEVNFGATELNNCCDVKKKKAFYIRYQAKTITSVVYVPPLKNKVILEVPTMAKISEGMQRAYFVNRIVYRHFCLMCSILIIPSRVHFHLSEA